MMGQVVALGVVGGVQATAGHVVAEHVGRDGAGEPTVTFLAPSLSLSCRFTVEMHGACQLKRSDRRSGNAIIVCHCVSQSALGIHASTVVKSTPAASITPAHVRPSFLGVTRTDARW